MKKILIIISLIILTSCSINNAEEPLDNPDINSSDQNISSTIPGNVKNVDNYNNDINTLENYYIDSNNNKINNSELISKEHINNNYVITNMKISSSNNDKSNATIILNIKNNTSSDLSNTGLVITFEENDGTKNTVFFGIESIKSNETIELTDTFKERIINAKDYTFEIREITGVG